MFAIKAKKVTCVKKDHQNVIFMGVEILYEIYQPLSASPNVWHSSIKSSYSVLGSSKKTLLVCPL